MKFTEIHLKGAYIIGVEPIQDERGLFARTFCEKEFLSLKLNTRYPQSNVSFNVKKGTLRGMHYQAAPYEEVKLVRCTRGEIYDVIVDIRKESETYLRWEGFILSSENRNALYIPKGFAHGFLTMQDNTEVHYMMGEFYHPELVGGIRWNDTRINVKWPIKPTIVSSRDQNYPDYTDK